MPHVKVVTANKAIIHTPEVMAHITSINSLTGLKVRADEAEVFITEKDQIGDAGPKDVVSAPNLYKSVTAASLDSEMVFLRKHGWQDTPPSEPGFRLLKVAANTTTRRVFYGMEDMIAQMRESGAITKLVVTVETRSKWEHKDAIANMSVYGFQEIQELAIALPEGYTAHVFTKRSAAELVTDLWCKRCDRKKGETETNQNWIKLDPTLAII